MNNYFYITLQTQQKRLFVLLACFKCSDNVYIAPESNAQKKPLIPLKTKKKLKTRKKKKIEIFIAQQKDKTKVKIQGNKTKVGTYETQKTMNFPPFKAKKMKN